MNAMNGTVTKYRVPWQWILPKLSIFLGIIIVLAGLILMLEAIWGMQSNSTALYQFLTWVNFSPSVSEWSGILTRISVFLAGLILIFIVVVIALLFYFDDEDEDEDDDEYCC